MNKCIYTAQGDLVCVPLGGAPVLAEGFSSVINLRPNETNTYNNVLPSDILKEAITNGCTVNVTKDKGYNITNCKTPLQENYMSYQ